MTILQLLLGPETPGSGGGSLDEPIGELQQDLNELGDDKPDGEEELEGEADEVEDGEEPEPEEEEEEPEPEEKDDEEEEKDETKEIERDETGRPTVKSIKAKYPGLFKDFPEIKHAFFALPKYEEVFADPEQAKEAAVKASEFDALESALVGNGDPSLLVKTLNENNPRALKKVISNFAEAVRQHSPDDYLDLTSPIIEELCYHASRHGAKIGGQTGRNLQLAAQHIANYVFANGGEIPDISKRQQKQPSEAEKQLEQERAQHAQEKFQGAATEILAEANKVLAGVLSNKLNALTSFEKKSVMKDARAEIDAKLSSDRAFQASLARLWERAKYDNYSPASKERIKEAWLSRARQAAIPIRNRLRQEALDARSGESNKNQNGEEKPRKRTFPSKGGQPRRGGSSRVLDPSKIDWRKTSDMDILNKD